MVRGDEEGAGAAEDAFSAVTIPSCTIHWRHSSKVSAKSGRGL